MIVLTRIERIMLFLYSSNRGVYLFFAESHLDAINHIKTELHTENIKLTKIYSDILYQLKLPIGAKLTFMFEPNTTELDD